MPRSSKEEVNALLEGLGEAVGRAVDDLSRAVASHVEEGETPPVDLLQQDALAFGSTVAAQLERLSAEIARAEPSIAEPARHAIQGVLQYVAGWVEGGGVVLALLLDLDPAAFGDADALSSLLRTRLDFVAHKAAAALAPALATLPDAPVAPAAPAPSPKARLASLLAKAAVLGVRIKNVPEAPSEKYLDKLEAQLVGVAAKRQAAASSPTNKERLAALMELADRLKVRVKQVPEAPTEAWLDKMEGKLAEVAAKKGVPLSSAQPQPTGIENVPTGVAAQPEARAPEPEPASSDAERTGDPAPDRRPLSPMTTPSASLVDDPTSASGRPSELGEDRRSRVEALLERAAEAGLDLGRVPPEPSDEWIAATKEKLEVAIERRKAERKAERKRKEAERKTRIERLQAQAREHAVDLGVFPPFPTDDWLARAELRIQGTLLSPSAKKPADDHTRALRLDAVIAAATDQGIDLGDLPPDPDEVWLTWAEGRVGEASAANEAIAVESDGTEPPQAFLVFEEGTVQEQSWIVADEELTIGRGRGNTVQIRDDAGVSRKHCTIVLEDGRYYLRDEGSTKGTVVNGKKKSGQFELEGDEIILCGETKFVFRLRYGG